MSFPPGIRSPQVFLRMQTRGADTLRGYSASQRPQEGRAAGGGHPHSPPPRSTRQAGADPRAPDSRTWESGRGGGGPPPGHAARKGLELTQGACVGELRVACLGMAGGGLSSPALPSALSPPKLLGAPRGQQARLDRPPPPPLTAAEAEEGGARPAQARGRVWVPSAPRQHFRSGSVQAGHSKIRLESAGAFAGGAPLRSWELSSPVRPVDGAGGRWSRWD